MISVFKQLQELDATPDRKLIDEYNKYFGSRNPKFMLIVKNVRPCFFSGDIETPGKIVTVSLNPAYSPRKTKTEQAKAGIGFANWYNYCRNRFSNYCSDTEIHSVFKNLFKVIAPTDKWETEDKRDYLQKNLLNLDWCYYYSEKFPSINFDKLPSERLKDGIQAWDAHLFSLIEIAAPRYIFVHGKTLQSWVDRMSSDLKEICDLNLKNSYGRSCRLSIGKFRGTTIPIYYLEHFINIVNQKETLEKVNHLVNQS